ncbi:Hypothetical protein HVR_LOCUS576 [uncultured virus]|nr:Hypothetical protein HVR_LOCUS576 [uncultured virus]
MDSILDKITKRHFAELIACKTNGDINTLADKASNEYANESALALAIALYGHEALDKLAQGAEQYKQSRGTLTAQEESFNAAILKARNDQRDLTN